MKVRTFLLKAGATLVTIATTVSAAVFVTSHFKNPQAPLQPAVLADSRSGAIAFDGGLKIGPSVQPSDFEPVASTYAS